MTDMLVKETIAVDLNLVDVDPAANPRKGKGLEDESIEAMAASLQSEGQITPISLLEKPGGRYDLKAGERRYRGARLLGWKTLRAEVFVPDVDPERAAWLTHLENLHRVNLSEYDEAVAAMELAKAQKVPLTTYCDRTGADYKKLHRNVAWVRVLPEEVRCGWRDGDPRATHDNLARLAAMHPDDALEKWRELAAPAPKTAIPEGAKKSKKPRRPSPLQLEALMERVDSSKLPADVRELLCSVIAYVQGALPRPPAMRLETRDAREPQPAGERRTGRDGRTSARPASGTDKDRLQPPRRDSGKKSARPRK